MFSKPLISVIIPVYNGERYLAEAIESVLAQTYRPIEIVVVDDGSTDSSADVAERFSPPVRYCFQPNSGPAAARNTGLKMARGDIIGFLDQDDIWPAGKLALQVARLIENPSLEIVLGRTQIMLLSGATDGKQEFKEFATPWISMLLSSALFRKSVFDKVGLFDETMRHYADDLDWFLRAREYSASMVVLEQITLLYRIHGRNTTRDKTVRSYGLAEVLKKSLGRRRQSDGSVTSVPRFSDFDESSSRGHKSAN